MIQLVLGYGHAEFTRACIRSIYRNTPPDEIRMVVWENASEDRLRPQDIDPTNTVLLAMDKNYGCSTALNALLKDFGAALEQDIIYLSNDHYVFPGWIEPLLQNPRGFHAISPMHPYGLHDLHSQITRCVDLQDGRKAEFLDHPESAAKIEGFLRLIYGSDLNRFIREKIHPMPEVALIGQFWAGCFFLRKEVLGSVGLFRTDRGLACDEDTIWIQENIRGKYEEGVYTRCYIHHFQSITTNRFGLTMDHESGAFSRGPVPPLTDRGQAILRQAVQDMKALLFVKPKL